MTAVSMKELLESGVHFGHQTRRWNPRMKPYIFTERGGIYIIDLQKTIRLIDDAYDFIKDLTANGRKVLFVGTKKQCQDTIAEEAQRSGMPYVSHRWLGGLLTNYSTISHRIKRMHELRRLREEGQLELLPTREQMNLLAELKKLETNLGGVSDMDKLPAAVFVIDPRREAIVIKEARKLKLPIVALVDTNCDPNEVDYVIPGNDDAIRSCGLIIRALAEAAVEGKQMFTEKEMIAGKAAAEAAAKAAAEAAVAAKAAADAAAAAGETAPADRKTAQRGGGKPAGKPKSGTRPKGPSKPKPAKSAAAAKPAPKVASKPAPKEDTSAITDKPAAKKEKAPEENSEVESGS
ncbi:MAG: 30S ribosomal protein S2 [Actinobacteria bacterium]|nr:30S ribosomal protein S2 [Actinomycetota bacterium]